MILAREKIRNFVDETNMKSKIFLKKTFSFLKNEIFSKEYFIFLINLVGKKWSIYGCLVIYLIIILSFVIIGPIITEYQPSYFLTTPTTALILVLIIGIVASFIAVEIFRTPIDDGTELLTISKPLHRSQIFFVKCLIIGIVGTTMSFLGSIISIFCLLLNFFNISEFTPTFFGILIGTFLIFWFFAVISVLFSLYGKKILVLLVSTGIAFLTVIISILSALIIDKNNESSNNAKMNSISSFAFLDKINSDSKPSITQGFMYNGLESGSTITPEEAYKSDFNKSLYPKFALFDFASQLSSMLFFNSSAKDLFLTYYTDSAMNMARKIVFNPKIDWTSYNGVSLSLSMLNLNNLVYKDGDSSNIDNELAKIKLLFAPTYSTSISSGQSDKVSSYLFFTNYSNQSVLSDFDSNFLDFENKIWNEFMNKNSTSHYLNNGNNLNKNQLQIFFDNINDAVSTVIKSYFINKLDSAFAKRETMEKLNDFIYTGMVKNLIKGDFNFEEIIQKVLNKETNWNDGKNKKDFMKLVFLRLLGINFSEGLKNTDKVTDANTAINALANVFGNKIEFKIDNVTTYSFTPSYQMVPSVAIKSFQSAKYVSLYNPYLLFFSWALICAILTLISLIIYRRKDFK